jgi:hypothetical protein
MDFFELIRLNLLSPMALAFVLGIVATLVRSDLHFPEALYTALSIYLLLAIGLKGGAELSVTPLAQLWAPMLFALLLGAAIPHLVLCHPPRPWASLASPIPLRSLRTTARYPP